MPSHRMHRGLVMLSATAVAAIYMAGYLRTQAADASIGSVETPVSSPTAVVAVVAAAPTPPPTLTVPTAQTQASAYQDGTYTGQGTSRRGDVWVSVQIQGGHITNASITRSTLQYPLRDIANLPSQVVQRQSAQVDIISRATYSSQAFRGAVSQALASAKAG